MFDFVNLDGVDDDGETPEWRKWPGVKSVRRADDLDLAVLEDERVEQFAAGDEEYVFEKLEVPFLPEEGAFDPLGFFHDSTDAIEDRLACYNGQVVMNFVATAYEQHMFEEMEKEERKAHIDEIHKQRLALLPGEAGVATSLTKKQFDQKPFGWREIHSVYIGHVVGLPDGGTFAEHVWGPHSKLFKHLVKVGGAAFMTPGMMVQILLTLVHSTRPAPTGPRITRNAPWHSVLTDVFFPSPAIVDAGTDFVSKGEESPTFVHMVVISANKETGDPQGAKILENIKIQGSTKYPKRQGGK